MSSLCTWILNCAVWVWILFSSVCQCFCCGWSVGDGHGKHSVFWHGQLGYQELLCVFKSMVFTWWELLLCIITPCAISLCLLCQLFCLSFSLDHHPLHWSFSLVIKYLILYKTQAPPVLTPPVWVCRQILSKLFPALGSSCTKHKESIPAKKELIVDVDSYFKYPKNVL